MGKCVLNFDQMEILNKKSDTPHSDNDWMNFSFTRADVMLVRWSPLH